MESFDIFFPFSIHPCKVSSRSACGSTHVYMTDSYSDHILKWPNNEYMYVIWLYSYMYVSTCFIVQFFSPNIYNDKFLFILGFTNLCNLYFSANHIHISVGFISGEEWLGHPEVLLLCFVSWTMPCDFDLCLEVIVLKE